MTTSPKKPAATKSTRSKPSAPSRKKTTTKAPARKKLATAKPASTNKQPPVAPPKKPDVAKTPVAATPLGVFTTFDEFWANRGSQLIQDGYGTRAVIQAALAASGHQQQFAAFLRHNANQHDLATMPPNAAAQMAFNFDPTTTPQPNGAS